MKSRLSLLLFLLPILSTAQISPELFQDLKYRNLGAFRIGAWVSDIAVPENQNITLFVLIEHSPKKFLFENKEHDFPQRISYEFHKDGRMTAAIEGNVKGEIKLREFSFKIVDN